MAFERINGALNALIMCFFSTETRSNADTGQDELFSAGVLGIMFCDPKIVLT